MGTSQENLKLSTRQHNLERLMPRHFAILDLVLLGKTNQEIAQIQGLTKNYVASIVNSPTFQHELALRKTQQTDSRIESKEKIDKSVSEFLQSRAMAAAKSLSSGLKDANPTIRLKSAIELLDRSGYPKQTIVQQTNTNVVVMDKETLDRIDNTIQLLKHSKFVPSKEAG